jgi:hypothetical protein
MKGKVMSAREFHDLGILQEVNRRVLHPIGLALTVVEDLDTNEVVEYGPVMDFRGDAEGVYYGYDAGTPEHRVMCRRALKFDALWEQRRGPRESALGFMVQPAVEDLT